MKFSAFLLLLALTLTRCANAPGPDVVPQPGKAKDSTSLKLDAFLQSYMQHFEANYHSSNTPGAAVVIVKDSQIVLVRGFGPKVAGLKDSIDGHTVFRIGSLSKGFAGVLTGILVQHGVFHWEDPVQRFYPDFRLRDAKQTARVQLWHLLSHTTGLPYHACTNLIERGMSIPQIATQYLPAAPVSGKEGEFFAYQNVALCLVEEMMRSACGKSYQDLLTEKIFRPAGMDGASCTYEGICHTANKTYPHNILGAGLWRADSISPLYYNAAAAGGVNASIIDMGEWLKVLMGFRPDIVSAQTLDHVFQPVVRTDKERRIFPRWLPRDAASYALGWRVLDFKGKPIIYHGGYVNGFKSEIAFDRQDHIGICVLMNAATDLSNVCIPQFFELWEQMK